MAKTYYKKCINDYFDRLPQETIVTTDMVVDYMVRKNGEPADKVRKTVNVNLSRLEADGTIARISRGIYCKKIKTPLGDYVPSKEQVYTNMLVADGELVIGYETGLSLMNRVGLVSQMPKDKFIASNNYSIAIPKEANIKVQKPRVQVTHDNYKYLQVLDIINGLETAPVDANNPEKIIKETAKRAGIHTERLLLYARKFYSSKTLEKVIDIMWGDLEI